MSDKLYMNENEVAVYKDGKLHAITKVDNTEREFIESLKLLFPESDIQILNFNQLGREVPKNK